MTLLRNVALPFMSTISLTIIHQRPLFGLLKILVLLRLLASAELGLFLPLLISTFAESVERSMGFMLAFASTETRVPCS